ncbi:tyrosine-type recombinase/integrase [Pseudonocardia yunnanensis]|uniref:Tyrosine-type recombinase/integrase n=1 Tax=Pseudonocardia yunnanensis TaxID=58107 RepID=A0ABW4EL47_9PSEU
MDSAYDVRVWAIQTRYKTEGSKKKPLRYVVRWMVSGERFQRSYKIRAQADSFRSELLAAARNGELFDTLTGIPRAKLRTTKRMTWFEFACAYVDSKWQDSAPKSRKSTADNLIAITRALLAGRPGEPDRKLIGSALRHAFNTNERKKAPNTDVRSALRWIEGAAPSVARLAEPAELRSLLSALDQKHDGGLCAPDTIRLRRTTLRNALDYAVELSLLDTNPITEIKTRKHKTTLREVDRRSVANPVQARTLLLAMREINPRLTAFFGVMYYAALRPEEAVNLRRENLSLPGDGWGELHLERAAPEVGAEWTDSDSRTEERSLKHRHTGVGRTVPCAPELSTLLREHLRANGTAADGRLFRAMRSDGPLSSTVYGRAWATARTATFTPDVLASPLAKRPYDLRHAAVSTWLNATGDPTRVAEWAGHTVSVLLRVYARCLDGGEQDARKKVADRLRG